MKKTSKLFGSIALSAALALGTMVPAFAATATVFAASTGPNPFDGDQNADTTVSVYYNPDQLSATVPLYVTVVATNGVANQAENVICPTPEMYAIENTSATPDIKVAEVKTTPKTGWMLSSANPTGTGVKGSLDMTLQATDVTGSNATAETVNLGTAQTTPATTFADADWTAAPSEKIYLKLAGTSKLTNAAIASGTSNGDMGEAFVITYKIEKA